jgi:hypothetical protein
MPSILPTSAAVYSPFVIRYAYDAWVLGVSNHFAGGCKSALPGGSRETAGPVLPKDSTG